jgi:hypothetical protein
MITLLSCGKQLMHCRRVILRKQVSIYEGLGGIAAILAILRSVFLLLGCRNIRFGYVGDFIFERHLEEHIRGQFRF